MATQFTPIIDELNSQISNFENLRNTLGAGVAFPLDIQNTGAPSLRELFSLTAGNLVSYSREPYLRQLSKDEVGELQKSYQRLTTILDAQIKLSNDPGLRYYRNFLNEANTNLGARLEQFSLAVAPQPQVTTQQPIQPQAVAQQAQQQAQPVAQETQQLSSKPEQTPAPAVVAQPVDQAPQSTQGNPFEGQTFKGTWDVGAGFQGERAVVPESVMRPVPPERPEIVENQSSQNMIREAAAPESDMSQQEQTPAPAVVAQPLNAPPEPDYSEFVNFQNQAPAPAVTAQPVEQVPQSTPDNPFKGQTFEATLEVGAGFQGERAVAAQPVQPQTVAEEAAPANTPPTQEEALRMVATDYNRVLTQLTNEVLKGDAPTDIVLSDNIRNAAREVPDPTTMRLMKFDKEAVHMMEDFEREFQNLSPKLQASQNAQHQRDRQILSEEIVAKRETLWKQLVPNVETRNALNGEMARVPGSPASTISNWVMPPQYTPTARQSTEAAAAAATADPYKYGVHAPVQTTEVTDLRQEFPNPNAQQDWRRQMQQQQMQPQQMQPQQVQPQQMQQQLYQNPAQQGALNRGFQTAPAFNRAPPAPQWQPQRATAPAALPQPRFQSRAHLDQANRTLNAKVQELIGLADKGRLAPGTYQVTANMQPKDAILAGLNAAKAQGIQSPTLRITTNDPAMIKYLQEQMKTDFPGVKFSLKITQPAANSPENTASKSKDFGERFKEAFKNIFKKKTAAEETQEQEQSQRSTAPTPRNP